MSKESPSLAVVLVGLNGSVLEALEAHRPDSAVYVFETEERWRAKHDWATGRENFAGVELGDYEHRASAGGAVAAFAGAVGANGVIAGVEYAVRATASAAETLSLPGLGPRAASLLTDKAELRSAARAAALPQPAFCVLPEPASLPATIDHPVVAKPVDLQGSAGVAVVRSPEAWPAARQEMAGCLAALGGQHRVLVEDLLVGPEVSTEVLVASGEVVFCNVTEKHVFPGVHPVEIGHVVPAACGSATKRVLLGAVRRLVALVGVGSGLLHAEWILVGGVPHLVECAGRPPGDYICRLIDDAYGASLLADGLVPLLTGDSFLAPGGPRAGAAVRYVEADPGTVTQISGLEPVLSHPAVQAAEVFVAEGEEVHPLRCSSDRCGYVRTAAPTAARAWRLAEQLAASIRIETRGVA